MNFWLNMIDSKDAKCKICNIILICKDKAWFCEGFCKKWSNHKKNLDSYRKISEVVD